MWLKRRLSSMAAETRVSPATLSLWIWLEWPLPLRVSLAPVAISHLVITLSQERVYTCPRLTSAARAVTNLL